MDEIIVDSIKVRSDLVGDYQKTDKLQGYKAEMFLKKLFYANEEVLVLYLERKFGYVPHIQWLPYFYLKKYKKYLKDKESRQHIYDKYAEKQSLIEILCNTLIDMDSQECLELKEMYDTSLYQNDARLCMKMADIIVAKYKEHLKFLLPK